MSTNKSNNRCYTCKWWKVNAITQHTGMALCPKRKRFMSYAEECPQFFKVKCTGK